MNWWWLSFCDPDRPAGDRFVGGCFVQGRDVGCAVRRAWQLGCNPDGEVAGLPFSDEAMDGIGPEWRERLLSDEDVDALDKAQAQARARRAQKRN